MELDLNLLRVFCTVYEQGSVTGAAAQLHLTQPTVSHALKNLRRQCNDQLFVREGRGLRPTDFASSIFPQVKAGLAQISAAVSSGGTFDPDAPGARFVLALTDLGERAFLPPVMAALRRRAPGALLTVVPLDAATVPEDLLSNRIDAAICSPYIGGPDVVRTVLGEDDYVVVAARDHPRIGAELTLEQFGREPRIRLAPSMGHEVPETAAERAGVRGPSALAISRFSGLLAVVQRTDCIAVLPRFLAQTVQDSAAIRIFPHPLPVPALQVSLYTRDPAHQRPAQRWFTELIVEALGESISPDPAAPLRPAASPASPGPASPPSMGR